MTLKRLQFGEFSIAVNSLSSQGLLNGTSLPTSRPAAPPIQTRRWGRNGKHPNAIAESMKSEAGNAAALFKTKQIFRSPGIGWPTPATSSGMSAGSGVCNRWRCAFHAGPFANFIDVEVFATTDGTYGTPNAYAQVAVTDVAAGTTQTATFPTGPIASTLLSDIQMNQLLTQRIFIAPDRDYTVLFSEHGSSTFFATIAEFSSLSAYMGGYLPQNIAVNGPILAGYRQNVAELARALWTRGGWPLANWSIEDGTQQPTTGTSTLTNLIDATVAAGVTTLGTSAITASSPGWVIDVTGRARRRDVTSGNGIPVVLAVYGSCSVDESAFIHLVDEHGTVYVNGEDVMTVAPGWNYLNGFLPATGGTRKYDVQFASEPGTTTSIYAVSLYELTP